MIQWATLSLNVLYQIILPLFLALAVGFFLGRRLFPARLAGGADLQDSLDGRQVDQDVLRALSKLVFYVLSPCLAFSALSTSTMEGDEVSQVSLFVLLTTLVIGVLAWGLARSMRLSSAQTSSMMLAAMFGNANTFGLPLNELAFGTEALDRAIVFVGVQAVLLFGLGVVIAARAHSSSPAHILSRLVRVPILYALLLAGLVRVGIVPVPDPVLEATRLLGQGAIPLQLLVLGMQLSDARVWANWRLVGSVSAIRLLLAPLIAWPLVSWFGLTGLVEQVSMVEVSTPSAIFSIILSLEFDLAPDLATSVVFVTTVASPLTLIPLIVLLH